MEKFTMSRTDIRTDGRSLFYSIDTCKIKKNIDIRNKRGSGMRGTNIICARVLGHSVRRHFVCDTLISDSLPVGRSVRRHFVLLTNSPAGIYATLSCATSSVGQLVLRNFSS